MRICGVKMTHDGAVALIDDGLLAFSCEMEKLGNKERYSSIADLEAVFAALRRHGYEPQDVDCFAVDGWNRDLTCRWNGRDVRLAVAPYRADGRDGLFEEHARSIPRFHYSSYAHYAGHVAAAYCTSPFAARGQDAYVLAWDGLMFPYLYLIEGRTGRPRSAGPLFPIVGSAYSDLARKFPPFQAPVTFRQSLAIAGKVMAYVASGQVDEQIVADLGSLAATGYGACAAKSQGELELGAQILHHISRNLPHYQNPSADILASLHAFLARALLTGLRAGLVRSGSHSRNLCVTGGCGLNIKWNRTIRESGMFDEIWVPPFPNDSGSAIGTACCAMLGKTGRRDLEWDVYSGPALDSARADADWAASQLSVRGVAELLHRTGQPVVFLHGRAELGPRALGNRSIFAVATDPSMTDRLNSLKHRENYRPIAPICLERRARDIFDPGSPEPFMMCDHDVRPDWISRIPAIVHSDRTARLQTINERQNPVVFELLSEYERLSGIPVLCNTSANFSGCGFFPDVASATQWSGTSYVWSEGVLYTSLRTDRRPGAPTGGATPTRSAPEPAWAAGHGAVLTGGT
jgi:carbamoyltransferase